MVRQSVSLLFLFSDLSSCHRGSHDGQEGLWFRKFVVGNPDLTAHRKLCTVFCQPQYQLQIKALSFVRVLSVHWKVVGKTRLFGKRSLKEIGYVGVGSQVCPQRKKLNVSDRRRLALSFFALIPKNLACKDFACLATVSLHKHGGWWRATKDFLRSQNLPHIVVQVTCESYKKSCVFGFKTFLFCPS